MRFFKSARCTRCVYRANHSTHWVPSLLNQIIATQGVVYLKPISWTAKIHINTLLIIHLLLFKFHLSIHSFSPPIQVFFPFFIFLFLFFCTRRKVPWYSTFFVTVKLYGTKSTLSSDQVTKITKKSVCNETITTKRILQSLRVLICLPSVSWRNSEERLKFTHLCMLHVWPQAQHRFWPTHLHLYGLIK